MKKIAVSLAVASIAGITAWFYFQHQPKHSMPASEPPQSPEALSSKASPSGAQTSTGAEPRTTFERLSDAQLLNREVKISSENLARDWAQLQDTAKKDPAFAYALVLKLFECKRIAENFGGIENLSSETLAANKNSESLSGDAKVKASVCADLTPAQYAAYVDLIDFAAASGVVKAQVDYSDLVAASLTMTPDVIKNPRYIDEYKEKSMRYYQSAAQAGNAPALQKLSLAYSDGIITPKDDYSAYKYLFAFDLAAPRRSQSRDKLLVQFQSNLTSRQIASAQREATAIYNSCCRK
jgi:TPR repeat protein